MPPAFSDSTMAPAPCAVLELGDQPVADAAAEAAVVAGDRLSGDLGEVLGETPAPRGEVGEDENPFAGREHRLDDLLEPGELARSSGQRQAVVVVRGRVVADLLERGDGGQDRALLASRRSASATSATRSSSTAWYSPICSGVIVQWSSSSILSGSSAATSGSVFVRRKSRMPFSARSAVSPSPDIWAMNDGRGPTRPGLVKSRIAHRSPSAVLDRRAGEGQARAGRNAAQLLGRVAGRVLDRLRLVEHDPAPRRSAARASTSRTAVA